MLWRKLLRTAWKYRAQFISMTLMVAIGIGIFFGFNIEWYSIEKNTDEFYGETSFADYRIYSDAGFDEDDVQSVRNLGVSAERVLSVNVDVKDSDNSLALFSPERGDISKFYTTEGDDYDASRHGFWLSDRYAAENGISVGDSLTVTYRGVAVTSEVLGLGKSSEFAVCVADDNQLMPDYTRFGFVYASPETVFDALGTEYYPQINIISDMSKSEMEYGLEEALGITTLVVPKEDFLAYSGPRGEMEEGQTMGSILPVLFLVIAILTMVTTMHRIASNEKTQIGTLKALGLRDRRILRHYTSYGLTLGIAGSVLGIILGYAIAGMIISDHGMMSTYIDLPSWSLRMPPFCLVVLAAVIAFMTLISYLSVRRMLAGSAADALRPYTPRKVRPLVLEKGLLWKHLPFGTRWNLRDISRHKSRSLMTLLGVLGCMVLMVGGMGMRDTMSGFLDLIDHDISNYETRVNITESADSEEIARFADEVDGDTLSSAGVRLGENTVALEVYNITHDTVHFMDENGSRVQLSDDGAYICVRLADEYSVGDTVEFSPYGSDDTYSVKVIGILRSVMTENLVMTEECADRLGIPHRVSAVLTDRAQSDIPDRAFISGRQSKSAIMESYSSFLDIMNAMVAVLVVAAAVLGVVVLYNLGVMSYIERSREMATLKVVGFRDRHIGRILISQNIWITAIGVLLGLPAGYGTLRCLVDALASEYELTVIINPVTYILSMLLTFGVSLIVGFFIARKNRKIDMVEALKGAE